VKRALSEQGGRSSISLWQDVPSGLSNLCFVLVKFPDRFQFCTGKLAAEPAEALGMKVAELPAKVTEAAHVRSEQLSILADDGWMLSFFCNSTFLAIYYSGGQCRLWFCNSGV